jgi:hypothetical protein
LQEQAAQALERYQARTERLTREKSEQVLPVVEGDRKRTVIEAALAKSRARKASPSP